MKIGIPNFNNLLDGNFSLGRSKNKQLRKYKMMILLLAMISLDKSECIR